MKLQVLGTGCAKCELLYERVKQAAEELDLGEVEKVDDITEIMSSGVMLTPALVVDGEVKFQGKVPGIEELKQIIG